MDLDGDGYLSMFELEYFYEEQVQKMESMGIETLPFNDCLCQVTQILHVIYSIVTCCMFQELAQSINISGSLRIIKICKTENGNSNPVEAYCVQYFSLQQ